MPSPQTACRTFQNKFSDLVSKASELSNNLTTIIQTDDEDMFAKLRETINHCQDSSSELISQYQQEAKEILRRWFVTRVTGDPEKKREFLNQIEFEDSQRVTIDSFPPLLLGKDTHYLPLLIRKIKNDASFSTNAIACFDGLEEVGQSITFPPSFVSATKLRSVGKDVTFVQNTQHKIMLESLEEVGGNLDVLDGSIIAGLPKLKKVGQSFHVIGNSSFDSLPELEKVGGWFMLNKQSGFGKAPKLSHIGSSLQLLPWPASKRFIDVFPELVEVGRNLTTASFIIRSENIKTEIEDLQRQGKLKFDGIII